jgi:hypothetical protein
VFGKYFIDVCKDINKIKFSPYAGIVFAKTDAGKNKSVASVKFLEGAP